MIFASKNKVANKTLCCVSWRTELVSRAALLAILGLAILAALPFSAQAQNGPDIYVTIREFSAPRRAAPPPAPVIQRFEAPLPKIFRSRSGNPPPLALGFAPTNNGFAPLQRLEPHRTSLRDFPRGALPGDALAPVRKVRGEARRKLGDPDGVKGAGIASATNFCVRLCDGYAFPVGDASGNTAVQEHACRQACPAAQTALYTAPAGAKDFDAMTRGGASYSALPAAYRYREKFDNTCRCHAPGYATPASAVLTDLTLRPGDLIVSRMGFRHFDGANRLPYRARNFSDAVLRLTSPREVAVVRAMEVASVRGIMSPQAPNYLRERVAYHMREVEREARREASNTRLSGSLGKGFQELKAREASGNTTLKTVQKRTGFVALN